MKSLYEGLKSLYIFVMMLGWMPRRLVSHSVDNRAPRALQLHHHYYIQQIHCLLATPHPSILP